MTIRATKPLADRIRSEISEQTHDDVRRRGGPSSPTLTKILKADGSNVTLATARRLEKAFGWPPSSVAALSRGEPIPQSFAREIGDSAVHHARAQLNRDLARYTDHELTTELQIRMLLMASRLHAHGDDTLTFIVDDEGENVITSRPSVEPI